MKGRRALGLIMIAILCFAMLFSRLYIVENYNHDCDHDNCPICQVINQCENIIKSIIVVVVAGFIATIFAVVVFKNKVLHASLCNKITLVNLKVKLSN